MNCDVCGREFPERSALVALSMEVSIQNAEGMLPENDVEIWATQLAPYQVGKQYSVCYPCFFRKLGVKP